MQKDFPVMFNNGGKRCECGNCVWIFSQFKKLPVLTCSCCGFTRENGTNNQIETFGYKVVKRWVDDLFYEHVWVKVNA
jgi:hypothetical protein